MSSHHFVKEGQEPALIIANGQACAYDLLTNLMEWCPIIVALDGAYQRLQQMQIKPDVVIGDMDSLVNESQRLDVVYKKNEDQDSTDLDKGIEYLSAQGYTDINVVWATGNRLDHTVNNFATLAKYTDCNIVLYDDYSRCHILPKKYKKHYQRGSAISLVPIPKASGIVTKNLKYPLDQEELEFGKRSGTSNEVLETGIVEISYEQGILAIIESTDAMIG